MRIGIDIAPLRPPYTGVSNYLLWLLDALLDASPSDLEYEGFGYSRWSALDRGFVNAAASAANKTTGEQRHGVEEPRRASFKTRVVPSAARLLRQVPTAHALASAWRARAFASSVGGRGLDLFHASTYRAPSRRPPVATIPVVWDLSHVRYPETHPPSRIRWMRWVEEACREAPAVHTISDFTAGEIVELFGIPRSRLHVIPPAVGATFRDGVGGSSTLARLGLAHHGFALTVSTLEPRKNLKTLLEAFATLAPAKRAAMPLVVVGGAGWGDLGFGRTLERLVEDGSVRLAGYVSDDDLAALYSGARAMFYPSIYEGYGMPVIEALAAGTPVVASDAASLPEALGGQGRLVPALDVPAWAEELRRAAAGTDDLSAPARRARRRHATTWTWGDAARRTLDMYRAAI